MLYVYLQYVNNHLCINNVFLTDKRLNDERNDFLEGSVF